MSRTFTPGPAYRLFLEKLVEARIARGHSLEQLSEIIGLTPQQIAVFEAGQHPLTFTDVRNWLLALDVPFVSFARELDDLLDSTLTHDEGITFPSDAESEADAPDKYARAEPLPHRCQPSVPTIGANHLGAFLRARRDARSPHHRKHARSQTVAR